MNAWNAWTKRFSSLLTGLALAAALAVAAGCQSDSPTEPGGGTPATPKPPQPVVTTSITVTANPPQIVAGSQSPVNITVDVRRSDGTIPADQTPLTLTTTLGEFGSLGSGLTTTTVQIVNGRAQTVLFPGTAVGQATIRAELNGASGFTTLQIGQAATFFIASISPSIGNPQGGEEVVIEGGGFDGPVRVTFNSATAQVLSVTSNRIRVRTPTATAAGVTVPVGESRPVSVTVAINLNESGQAQDTLANGFIYALGGGISQPQVFSITPSSGTNDGGTQVQILGDGFEAPVQVFFGFGTAATSFNGVEATVTSVTRNRIVAITPAARGFGQPNLNQQVDVLVKNLNTGFSSVGPQLFKYGSQVLITSMGPGSGPYTGGTVVTLHGQGFDEPVAVSLGGVGQAVLSVTGTQIVFRTSGTPVTTCPANGIITASPVGVTNIESGDGTTANLGFNYVVPLPLIFSVNPTAGGVGSSTTVSGRNFAQNLQVLFGDATNGSSAQITGQTNTSDVDTVTVTVPTPPPGFNFTTGPCDGPDADTVANGIQSLPTAINVTVRNLDGTGCAATLTNVFTLNPPAVCNNDTPTQCSDGDDNDGDGDTDFPADTGCSSVNDNTEG